MKAFVDEGTDFKFYSLGIESQWRDMRLDFTSWPFLTLHTIRAAACSSLCSLDSNLLLIDGSKELHMSRRDVTKACASNALVFWSRDSRSLLKVLRRNQDDLQTALTWASIFRQLSRTTPRTRMVWEEIIEALPIFTDVRLHLLVMALDPTNRIFVFSLLRQRKLEKSQVLTSWRHASSLNTKRDSSLGIKDP